MRELKLFSGRANRPLAKAIAGFLNLSLGNVTLGDFPDGETFCKIDEDVREEYWVSLREMPECKHLKVTRE